MGSQTFTRSVTPPAGIGDSPSASLVELDDSPLGRFHVRLVISGSGGQFSDGYILGIVGISVGSAVTQLQLTPIWLGILGAASLAGLFFGAALVGPIADRIGRRPIFCWDMLVFSIVSILQFFVTSATQLLMLRLILGLTLGADYVVSNALVTEYCPRRIRGRLMSALAVSWALGYVCAYFVGFALQSIGPDAWRWMLISSALPAALLFPFRIGIPESPLWLVNQGWSDKAARVIASTLGVGIALPTRTISQTSVQSSRWGQLLSPVWRRRTLIACVFYTCQVIPFFGLGTFAPRVFAALDVKNSYLGGLIYTLFLLVGALVGLAIVDRISRRLFLVGSFYIAATTLAILSLWRNMPPSAVVGFFAVFACVLAAAANLEYVYTPELFPTDLRASGVGMAIAASRVGAAVSTFLLPVIVDDFGVYAALGGCVFVLVAGGAACHQWAPETGQSRLIQMSG